MDSIDTQSLMLQMRSLAAQTKIEPVKDSAPMAGEQVGEAPEDFGDLLKQSVEAVTFEQNKSKEMKNAFERGDPDVDLSEVMLQAQKASLSFQAMTQVRNKLVEAYKEVIQMPL
ncbi:flagellar hook-basal body complex protein FliE [Thiomicrorhabdus indica]|uniref:flagellar hook-basal body complex protein FliE n=1 Tax=Thiomicrorhabdus indica TaxID=2267253 RepID=UPI00102DD9F5|nr:flagellar hook-basal body complex protein FliE [Thiomicrorhabdus indica]